MTKQGLESTKDIAAGFIRETYNNHNLDVADDVLVPDFVFHNAGRSEAATRGNNTSRGGSPASPT